MSALLLGWSITLAQIIVGIAMACAMWRLVRGPQAQDRVLAFDTLYIQGMLILLTLGIQTGRTIYFEGALIIALLGFVGTVALSKFLMRGEVIE